MARVLMSGWESGSVDEIGGSLSGSLARQQVLTPGRTGSYYLALDISSTTTGVQSATKTFTLPSNYSEVWIRCAMSLGLVNSSSIPPATNYRVLRLLDSAAATQIQIIRIAASGQLEVYRGGTKLGTCGHLTPNWQVWEIHLIVNNTTGVLDIWVDGVLVFTFSGDTQETGNANVGSIALEYASSSADAVIGHTHNFDDLAINDVSGSVNNGQIGRGGIHALVPTSDTAQKDFTPDSGSTNFSQVDEIPADDNTTYVQSSTVGHRDLYGLADIAGNGLASAVAIVGRVVSANGAGAQGALTVKSNTTVQEGPTKSPGTSYEYVHDIINTDPDTTAQWTLSGINALEAGQTVK